MVIIYNVFFPNNLISNKCYWNVKFNIRKEQLINLVVLSNKDCDIKESVK